jgi:hypothetical protein
MVRFHSGLLIAQAIVSAWMAQVSSRRTADVCIETYQNGREQGLCVWNLDLNKSAYISEYRNSDEIVVYIGSRICMQGLSDAHYKNARFFRSVDEAVKYIEENNSGSKS